MIVSPFIASLATLTTLVVFKPERYVKTTRTDRIPHIIWSYSCSNVSPNICQCVDSWAKCNPGFRIIVVNDKTIKLYCSQDICTLFAESKCIDLIRLHVLSTHGGFWFDSGVFCNQSLEWCQRDIGMNQVFCVYDKACMTASELLRIQGGGGQMRPIYCIGAGFIACVPNSLFMCDWHTELCNHLRTALDVNDNDVSDDDMKCRLAYYVNASAKQVQHRHKRILIAAKDSNDMDQYMCLQK